MDFTDILEKKIDLFCLKVYFRFEQSEVKIKEYKQKIVEYRKRISKLNEEMITDFDDFC